MKRFLGLLVVVLLGVALAGCGKKQEAEELQPITMESLSTMSTASQPPAEVKAQESNAAAVTNLPAGTKELAPLPPAGPYKPAATDIQTALKNAGFYSGAIDGKLGPKSKKAIEAFQKANGLKADGKVGPKTWEALSSHLNVPLELPKR